MTIPLILFVVFLVLKLTGAIAWSWLWVLAPIWIPFTLTAIAFLWGLVTVAIDERRWSRK